MAPAPTLKSSIIPKIWSALNYSASRFYSATPNSLRRGIDSATQALPASPAKQHDSGDYINRPSFMDAGVVSNAIRRYLGAPSLRAVAWEELGIFLQRWGWRMSDLAYEQAYNIRADHDLMTPPEDVEHLIFESEHFRLMLPQKPLIDRRDGGHVVIHTQVKTVDRMHFTPEQVREYMPFCNAVGRAFMEVMNESGIPVERLNWMDMGNWSLLTPIPPRFHVHVFGRARGSRFQIHGEFNQIPPKGSKHYDMIKNINAEEIAKLKARMSKYFPKK